MSTIVKLTKDEVRVCTLLAVERWLTKFGSKNQPNYAEGKADGRLQPELAANVRANVAEWAVAKHYNINWNVPWYPNDLHGARMEIPDVGVSGEVRTVRTKDAISVWRKDAKKTIIGTKVLDEEYYSEVEIFGWYPAYQAFKEEWKDEYINGWRIPIGEFIYAQ